VANRPAFTLAFADRAIEHLKWIEPKHHGLIRRTIEDQLSHTPLDATRNRKLLIPPAPFEASWELRCGPGNRFRVLYKVDSESQTVLILAIGVKDRNRLLFGESEDDT